MFGSTLSTHSVGRGSFWYATYQSYALHSDAGSAYGVGLFGLRPRDRAGPGITRSSVPETATPDAPEASPTVLPRLIVAPTKGIPPMLVAELNPATEPGMAPTRPSPNAPVGEALAPDAEPRLMMSIATIIKPVIATIIGPPCGPVCGTT